MKKALYPISFTMKLSFMLLLMPLLAFAQPNAGDYRSAALFGDWSAPSTWEVYNGTNWIPALTPPDTGAGIITLRSQFSVNIFTAVFADQIVVEQASTLFTPLVVSQNGFLRIVDGPGDDCVMQVGAGFACYGKLDVLSNARIVSLDTPSTTTFIQFYGDTIINNGTISVGFLNFLSLGGNSIPQWIKGSGEFSNIFITNPNGVYLENNIRITNGLWLDGGNLITGPNHRVTLSSAANVWSMVPPPGPGNYVDGNLEKEFSIGNSFFFFRIGNAGVYRPVRLSFNALTPGSVTASSYSNDHPSFPSSQADSTQSVNAWWRLMPSLSLTVDPQANFMAEFFWTSDADTGTNPFNFSGFYNPFDPGYQSFIDPNTWFNVNGSFSTFDSTFGIFFSSFYPPLGGYYFGDFVIAEPTTAPQVNISQEPIGPLCEGSFFSASVFLGGVAFNGANKVYIELSDANGSFASPLVLDSLTCNSASCNFLNIPIPPGIAPGTGYRVRAVSSWPFFIGPDNGSDISLNVGLQNYWMDADGDGFGAIMQASPLCSPLPGYSTVTGDCDDTDPNIFPGQGCGGGPLSITCQSDIIVCQDNVNGACGVALTAPAPIQLSPSFTDRNITYTGVSINGGGNSAVVTPGATVNLNYNVTANYNLSSVYCPGCIVQAYIGIGGTYQTLQCEPFIQVGYSNTYNGGSFTAPTVPGVYYLTHALTLDYFCQPVLFSNNPSDAIGVLVVGPPFPVVTGGVGPVVVTNDAPGCFPVGTNLVTWTATDSLNNTISCSQIITVTQADIYYRDRDQDGFGNPMQTGYGCISIPPGYVSNSLDCNDDNFAVSPVAQETICNGLDENCNGSSDDGSFEPVLLNNGDLGVDFCQDTVNLAVGLINNKRFVNSILGFSSETSPSVGSAAQVIGNPDVWPSFGINGSAWSALTSDIQREYLEVEFSNPDFINFIDIYETANPGAIDTVYVKNPGTGLFESVYVSTATPLSFPAWVLRIKFPLTTFVVSQVRIALNEPAVPGENQIDAIAIGRIDSAAFDSYNWSNGASTAAIAITTPGLYSAQVTNNGCTATSNQLFVNGPQVFSGPTQFTICQGDELTLTANPGFVSYLWSNGSTTASIAADPYESNIYVVTVTDSSSCSYTGTVEVEVTEPYGFSNLFVSEISCPGGSDGFIYVNYEGGNGPAFTGNNLVESDDPPVSITGPNGYFSQGFSGIFENLAAGVYTVTVNINGCNTDTVITLGDEFPDVTIQADGPLCPDGGFVTLSTVDGDYGYLWSPGNETSSSIIVTTAGIYTVSVQINGNCTLTDTITIVQSTEPCIIPAYDPPPTGSTTNIIGAELTTLAANPVIADTISENNPVYLVDSTKVLIEIISNAGFYDSVFALMQTPPYGMSDFIDNGDTTFIITGLIPIINLPKLDSLPTLINYVRPYFPPVSGFFINSDSESAYALSTGITKTQGDRAMGSDSARVAWRVNGDGVKVGVISDSYNTKSGNQASINISNEDLPGPGNPNNAKAVKVLQEFPFGRKSDEGRAMLQIIHDVAPKAELAFYSGFVSAGNMAEGVKALRDSGCDVIIDDVTYITESFFYDGVVSQAVNEVVAQGATYISSAGNFGSLSYESTFNPVPAPPGYTGFAHDFGGGDVLQSVNLKPGTYTIVLQWSDSVYSLGQLPGAANDFDIFLLNTNGTKIFGFNRDNSWGDPLEVVPFTVSGNTQANILITRRWGSGTPKLKYVIFRGDAVINEHNNGSSTVVGQANAKDAIAVGAVLYTNTPNYGVNPPTAASFSSRGGMLMNGVDRQKPDIMAPNGVNTTVPLGGTNIDNDAFPNFFGTSAAAPHIAGAVALIQEASMKYSGALQSGVQIKNLLRNTALDMYTPGYDVISGAGFIQIDSALMTLGVPAPIATSRYLGDSTQVPGLDTIQVFVTGKYFSNNAQVIFRYDTLEVNNISNKLLSLTLPPFVGNPPLRVYNPPTLPGGPDGGTSDTLYLIGADPINVLVVANNASKRYGEKLPIFSATVTVNGVPLAATGLTLADLGLDNTITFSTPANNGSNVGQYFIRPASNVTDLTLPLSQALAETYNFLFADGLLEVERMPITIRPKDTTVVYGDYLDGFGFDYIYDATNILPIEQAGFLGTLKVSHETDLASEIALVDRRALVNGRALVNADIDQLSCLASARALVNRRALVNARALVNGVYTQDTTKVVDVAVASVFNYQDNPDTAALVNARALVNRRALVNARALVNRRALVNGRALVNRRALVNGFALVNSSTVSDSTDNDMLVIIDEADVDAPEGDSLTFNSINLVTGLHVGTHSIVPGALLDENYEPSYELGTLTVTPATLTVTADNKSVGCGSPNPVFTSEVSGYRYNDADSALILSGPSYGVFNSSNILVTNNNYPTGSYSIVPGNVVLKSPSDYDVTYVNGTLNSTSSSSVGAAPGAVSSTSSTTACLPGVAGSANFSIPPVSGAISYSWTSPPNTSIQAGQGTAGIALTWTSSAIQNGIKGKVCVIANDLCGASQSSCIEIDYQVAAPVRPPSISGPGKVCPGDIATYSVAAVPRAKGYSWVVPAGMTIISGQGNNIIEVQVGAAFSSGNVTVVASNTCGNSPQRAKSIVLNPPAIPAAISGERSGLCNASGVSYTIIPVPGATSYSWTVSNGSIVSGQGSTSIFVNFGTFTNGTVTVRSSNACGTSSVRTLSVTGTPAQAGAITFSSLNVCTNASEAYSVSTVTGASNYIWSATNGGSVSGGQGTKNITVQWGAAPATLQSVQVQTSNACGLSPLRVLNNITVSGCGRSELTGALGLMIFPNPATSYAMVQFDGKADQVYRLRITDITGKVVLMKNGRSIGGVQTEQVNIETLAKGFYHLQVETEGLSETLILMKE